MKRLTTVMAVIFAAAWLCGCAQKGKNGVAWLASMDEGKKVAVKDHKPLFVYFTADWSADADKFEKTVLVDPLVVKKTAGFVAVMVDADFDEDTPKEYGVNAFPTTIFYYPNGDEVKRLVGAVAAPAFLKIMDDVQARRIETEKQMLAREAAAPDDIKIAYDVGTYYLNANRPERAIPRFEKVLAGDPENKTGFAAGAYLQLGFMELTAQQPEAALARFKTLTEKCPGATETPKAYVYMGDAYQLMDQPDDATAAYETVTTKYAGTPEAAEAQAKLGKMTMLTKTVEAFTGRPGETAATTKK